MVVMGVARYGDCAEGFSDGWDAECPAGSPQSAPLLPLRPSLSHFGDMKVSLDSVSHYFTSQVPKFPGVGKLWPWGHMQPVNRPL